MNDRFALLRQKILDDQHAHTVQAALVHQLDAGTTSKLAFALGSGAGQISNLLDALANVTELHEPTPGSEFCHSCSGDNAPVSWPCPTTNAIAAAYRHDHVFLREWAK